LFPLFVSIICFQAIGIPADDVNLKLLKPPKQKEVGSFNYVVTPNAVCQADLTFWPNDHGYQYLLSIVDVVDRSIDAEPLRTKTSIAIKDGFDKIFARNYVKPTFRILQTDPGSEFKNATIKEYFNDKNIVMRYGRTGRHNQQAIIEYYNGVIGKTLNTKMRLSE
jgi:transposase InsO family protein